MPALFITFAIKIIYFLIMQHHKKISEKQQLLRWLVILAIIIVVFFQIFSSIQQYKYLSEILNTMLDAKFEQAVEQYRTSRLKKIENTFSIEFNPENEKETIVDIDSDYKSDKLSFDQLMYKMIGHAISREELYVNELDSIYKVVLMNDNLQADFDIVVYTAKTDTIIAQTSDIKDTKHQHTTLRKEIDAYREAQVFFRNPISIIFQKMFLYIVFSGLMLIAVVVALIYQLKIIFKQKKIEQIRQDFTDSMVHELRNPLQSAISMAELAENETFLQNIKRRDEVIGRLKNNLNNLSQLLTSLVERSFSENTQQEAHWEMGNLAEYINEIVENTTTSANKPIRFNTVFVPITYNFAFDHVHLPNGIKNLVENAVKYSGDEVSISITTAHDDVFLYISIADNGFGISKEDLPHIFMKFYRGNSVQKKYGFGLGLSYVKWVAELHNGHVNVESEKEKGSKFTLTIPLKTN